VLYARDAADFRHENWWEKTPRGEFWVDGPRSAVDQDPQAGGLARRVPPG
jgi:hypothetical protein